MPTYIVSAATQRFNDDLKHRIADGITKAHSRATGAQGFFAQVIFNEIPAGNHFIGGSPLKAEQVFIHGHIRAGRTSDQKRQLLESIVEVIISATALESRYVWAYISELPPSNMVEYGHILPEPGAEEEWLKSMDEADRNYLLGMATDP
jgi:phenylpyruvate tautomerase PptA (4-oxalocrotonate tautomerase family)